MSYKVMLLIGMFAVGPLSAKIDLVSLPERDTVQVTIYNSADLTLVRESRSLTLREGINRMQFSWANTLIDPTSLGMVPLKMQDQIDVFDLTYPPRTESLGVWNIQSEVAGNVPIQINYLTSGMSWRAFYMGTLSPDESRMRLQGYVRVTNNSGEDYEHAQTRLVVGKVHMLDEISALAKRAHAYGSPLLGGNQNNHWMYWWGIEKSTSGQELGWKSGSGAITGGGGVRVTRKEIVKEGLSEYFVYTIEGTETILNGWSKRLPSFDLAEVPVEQLYKYDEERFGNSVVRFLAFENSEEDALGETPIPGGLLKVYRGLDADQHLSYEGQATFKYIPVDEHVELSLGVVGNVRVLPVVKELKFLNHTFSPEGNVSGWDEVRAWEIEISNTRSLPVSVQITRKVPTTKWTLQQEDNPGVSYKKWDVDHLRFDVDLAAGERKTIAYRLTTFCGERGNQ